MNQNFSHLYEIMCNLFYTTPHATTFGRTKLGLARFLGMSQGKTQSWEKGQWPKAEDLRVLHQKMGFSYRWLVTGEGDPFDDELSSCPPTLTANSEPLMHNRTETLERENAQLRELLEAKNELLASKDKIIALHEENKRLAESVSAVVTPTETRRDNPQHATSDRPASGATDCGV